MICYTLHLAMLGHVVTYFNLTCETMLATIVAQCSGGQWQPLPRDRVQVKPARPRPSRPPHPGAAGDQLQDQVEDLGPGPGPGREPAGPGLDQD